MTVSEALWLASLAILLVATGILFGLIAYRILADRRRARRRLERQRCAEQMLASGEVPARPGSAAAAGETLADVAVAMIALVRGEEKQRLIERAAALGVDERLRRRLRRGNVRARILSAEALCHFVDPASTAALDSALEDRSADVRLTAALSLAAAGRGPKALELVRRLGIGRDVHSRLAVTLLTEIARRDIADVRTLIRTPDVPAEARAAAAEALAACDDFAIVPELVALAVGAETGTPERIRYLEALAALEHPAAAPAVMHGLDSPEPSVRACAARAAARIRLSEAGDRLAELLGDPDWWVRFRAGRALVRLGAAGEALLRDTAAQDGEPARTTAALTLAEHEGVA